MPGYERIPARWIVPALAFVAGAAAVALRCWWAVRVTPEPVSDAATYWSMAQSLAAGDGYDSGGQPTAYRPIGYPAALAALIALFGGELAIARGFNAALAAASLASLYALTRALTGSQLAALVALCLFGFYPADVGYTSVALSEPLFNALCLGAACAFTLRPRSIRAVALAGVLLGFATLTRPQGALVLPCLVAALFVRETQARRALQLACVLVLACAVSMAPWWLRNARVFGAFVAVSTNGGVNLYIGNHAEADGHYTFDEDRDARIDARLPPGLHGPARELAYDREAARLAFAYVRAEPERTVALWKRKLVRTFMHEGGFHRFSSVLPEEQRPLLRRLVAVSLHYYVLFLLLSAAGFVRAAFQLARTAEARTRLLWLPAMIAAAFTLLVLLTFGDSRFHHPVMPWFAIYAGLLVASLARAAELVLRLGRSGGRR